MIAGPMFQAVPVIALGFEFMLGSIPKGLHIMGALCIVAGGLFLSIERDENSNLRKIDWKTIGLMSISVVIVALVYVLFKKVSGLDGYIAVGFWTGVGMFITSLGLLVFWTPYRENFIEFCKNTNAGALGTQLINECLDAIGVYLTHYANIIGPSVMLVTAFNATQPIFILILGVLLSWFGVIKSEAKDKITYLLIVFGIILIALGTVLVAM
jgi:drug/metabolite transporter (DMT)-like permease